MNIITTATFNFANNPPNPTNNFHPMKGPMTTQTLQDIIGHEPFHWRGDRDGIEAFSPTFTNLQGMPGSGLTTTQMQQFKSFLATVRFGPNPFRNLDNSLVDESPDSRQLALGRGTLTNGAQLPNGNAVNGLNTFRLTTTPDCIVCHRLPTGLGTDMNFNSALGIWIQFPVETNGSHHIALVELARSSALPFKIPSLRNIFDKLGMDSTHTNSRAGFGFLHDGSVDTMVRFLQDGLSFTNDQQTADMVAFMLSFTGSDLTSGSLVDANRSPGVASLDTPAGVGKQITVNNAGSNSFVNTMIAMVNTQTNRVDLIVKGFKNGVARGWFYNVTNLLFYSDRPGETYAPAALRSLAATGSEQTYTLVPKGAGWRMAIDRDLDGILDGQLILQGISVSNNIAAVSCTSAVGATYQLQYKTHLSDTNWALLPVGVPGTGNAISISDTTVGANQTRFYRVTTVE